MSERDIDIEIAEKMKAHRENRKLSQRQVAKLTNISNGYISKIESGHIPSLKILKKLTDFYGLKMPELFGEVIELPEELKKEGIEWMAFAKDMVKEDMTPEKVKEYIEIVRRIQKNL